MISVTQLAYLSSTQVSIVQARIVKLLSDTDEMWLFTGA